MRLATHWQDLLAQQQAQTYFQHLNSELAKRRAEGRAIYPPESDIFAAFSFKDLAQINVVILGQDPYHGHGQAHGLAFSVHRHHKVPPSLVNIYKELSTDIADFTIPSHGCLTAWAQQGVLLLNSVLTVEQGQANAHAKLGWHKFTDAVIAAINAQNSGCVFMLWGLPAQKKGRHIDSEKHCILTAPHPSPLSVYRGFYGCRHFSIANQWLAAHKKTTIDWRLD
jgi:uracil-DNA glycosylase